jgi:CHAT domain-containing protein
VASVVGPREGSTHGISQVGNNYDPIKKDLENLESDLDSRNDTKFQDRANALGDKIFKEIIVDGSLIEIYKLFTSHYGNRSHSSPISFLMMDDRFLDLPVEFMKDKSPFPIATRYPVYKTITTRGDLVTKREDFSIKSNLQILLLSSDVNVVPGSPILIGDQEVINHKIKLDPIAEVDDQSNSEIVNISKIINVAKEKKKLQVQITIKRTSEIDYKTFLDFVSKGQYHIIHYNGHGYFDETDPKNSFIFFRENLDNKGRIVALTNEQLGMALTDNTTTQFMYMSCCQSGSMQTDYKRLSGGFTGLLHALIVGGVPSVLGMRWPISISSAKTLAMSFYSHLFNDQDNNTIETALMRARKDTYALGDKSVWCSPILIKQQF